MADAIARAEASSTEAAAQQFKVSRRTLRRWRGARVTRHDAPRLSAFLESPEGVRELHRIVLAAILVFGVIYGVGAGGLRLFILLSGLSPWVACSESTLLRAKARVVAALGPWGQEMLTRLGATMHPRELTVLVDETWKRLMILVGMDAASGFILLQQHAESRDGETWYGAMKAVIDRLRARILQVVADDASGITKFVAKLPGAHRANDLFHGLYELGPVVRVLHRKCAAAKEAAASATGEAKKRARALVRVLTARLTRVTDRIREVSDAFHPFDLASGRAVSVEAMRKGMEQAVARVQDAAIKSEVSARVVARIEKAQRLIPSWTETLVWWQGLVARTLATLDLSEPLVVVMREIVLPLRYLESVRARASQASERQRLDDVLGTLRARLSSATVWSAQPIAERDRLEAIAVWLVGHFVRASSALEGHNGSLSLRYHQRRDLPPALLDALTVIHNYVIRREDGTTAAERFFGRRHDDLFEYLLEKIAPLPRPRRRRA